VIDLYTWTTPNGRKVSILLEELGVPYTAHAVDIMKGEQFDPAFKKISPNNKIPAIFDLESGLALMESGAILIYLADLHARFLARDGEERHRAIEWVMWQMAGLGPIVGQTHHFLRVAKGKSPYAEERFTKEVARLYSVLDERLEGRDYVAGDYSIADMAIWPSVSRFEWHAIDLNDYANVRRWYQAIARRPAVIRGYAAPIDVGAIPQPLEVMA
jgi:GST-like protein